MNFKNGDYVTRKSHNNDIVFQIMDIEGNRAILKGIEVRLLADSNLSDLVKIVDVIDLYKEDRKLTDNAINSLNLDRDEFFIFLVKYFI